MTDLQARLRAARESGASADRPVDTPLAKISDGALMLACVLFAALVAIGFGIWTLIALLIAAATKPGFWLGVVVVAVLAKLAGWW
jgi:hypothetical protein